MPASRRTILLIATAAALIAALAVLPAPRLIFRRSPVVSDRIAGDVRRVAMAVEPDGSLHAALEVWTDSDWDIEYWSSITGLTPVARVVNNDLIEQRDVTIAMTGDRLAMAWVDVDAKAKTFALQVTTKKRIDRDWAKPITIARGAAPIIEPHVNVSSDGRPFVVFIEAGLLARATVAGPDNRPVRATLPEVRGARHPRSTLGPAGGGIVYESAGGIWMLDRRRLRAGDPTRIAAAGRGPAITSEGDVIAVAWGERDAIVVRVDGAARIDSAAPRRIPAPGLGGLRPSVGFAGVDPVAAWSADGVVRAVRGAIVSTLADRRSCCGVIAGNENRRVWTAWLESEPSDAILRRVRLRFEGPPGRFTTGDRIPVVALPTSR